MSKAEKGLKPGIIIKLSCETVQKLSEDEQSVNDNQKSSTSNFDVQKQIGDDHKDITKNHRLPLVSKEVKQSIILEPNAKNSQDISLSNDNLKSSESWGEYAPYITYEDEEAFYTDPNTHKKYKWNKSSNIWDPQAENEVPGRQYSYEDDTHVYTDSDGSKFFWDALKKAWIPKVDDDFLALYQMSYGFVDNVKPKDVLEEKPKTEKKQEANLKRKNEPQWFDPSDQNNTKVYVSNLPLDTTEDEFVDLMQKCGLVERDPGTQKMKIKLYMDKEQSCFKGDALCTYIKIESVNLALSLLDGCDFKGNKIKVEKAHFQLKGEYNPALKPKKKRKKELEKIKKMQQKLFDWRPEKIVGERSKHERVVIVKNLFHPSDFDNEVQLILDYQQDLREECGKCGDVRKVVIYDRHPEGVAQITMKEPEHADAVIQLINGRWFGKRQITAEIWDGRTKYKIAETDADISKRIDKWDKFLEQGEKDCKDVGKKVQIEASSEESCIKE
ncbi:HIV Tat-specific factor 1 homolog [Pieris napi]|uniref:HIV Tat-specific factor 1 homolog n=1 Tax=Pieris napi TaxID=78633 RepID=UPI001FBA0A91|nr:HIV Tat-specific factor 1 homolog [Pieris napi]